MFPQARLGKPQNTQGTKQMPRRNCLNNGVKSAHRRHYKNKKENISVKHKSQKGLVPRTYKKNSYQQ